MHYERKQWSRIVFPIVGIMAAICIFPLSQVLANTPVLTRIIVAVIVLIPLLFGWMTVIIDTDYLRVKFGLGIVRKKWKLSDVASVEIVRNKWWWGWGIRYYGKGWLYNIAGLGAVEITLRDGKYRRIGTDEPAKLADVIRSSINQ